MADPRAAEMPAGSVLATGKAVWIKRRDVLDGTYWMPSGAFAVQMTDRQMQTEIDVERIQVLRVGDGLPPCTCGHKQEWHQGTRCAGDLLACPCPRWAPAEQVEPPTAPQPSGGQS